MGKNYTVFVVPHTHWDRAWYVPFEEFRLRLIGMIDDLCHTLETDPEFTCFTLDGQAIVLDDYLEIRRGSEERLRKLISSGRMSAGPWYVLPDEFLVSPESLIRNLMYGRKLCARFGRALNVGYVPDPFGHIAQLPQILRGFGIDSFVFFRGIDQETTKLNIEFVWRAPDGSEVIASQQRPFYGNGTHLGYATNWGDTENMVQHISFAIEQVEKSCGLLAEHSIADSLLLGNGIDQAAHQKDLPRILKKLAKHFPQYRFRVASLEEYIAQIKRDLKGRKPKVHRGELMYQYGDLLRGVDSTRMYMKMLNQHCEDLFEKWTEPAATVAWLNKLIPYPQDELWHGWCELMKTHPHDDVTGAAADQVHREAENRYATVEQVGAMIARNALRRFALNTDNSKQPGVPVLLFNTLPMPRKEVVRIPIDLVPYDEPWKTFTVFNDKGKPVPHEALGVERLCWWEAMKPFDVHRHTVEIEVDLPPFGYRTLYVREGEAAASRARFTTGARAFENEFFKLQIAANGSLTFKDKATRREYRGLLVFEDTEDCGDAYNWSYLAKGSQTFTTGKAQPKIAKIHEGPLSVTWRITHTMRLPESLTADHRARSKRLVPFTFETDVTCRAGSPRVDLTTRVTNNVKDHRLRALFPTDIEVDTVLSDGHFAVVERSTILPPAKPKLPPYPTQHQLRFSAITDGKRGFAVINDGMPEIQVLHQGAKRTLAHTLFRAVGWLGRDDFPTRPYSAAPSIAAPEAQCLRTMEFRYGFMAFKGGDWTPVMQEALRHNVDIMVTRSDVHGGTDLRQMGFEMDEERAAQKYIPVPREGRLPDHDCVMDINNARVILSAFKKCEHNTHLLVRLHNPGTVKEKGTIRLFRPIKKAWSADLAEERTGALRVTRGALNYALKPYEIATFEIDI